MKLQILSILVFVVLSQMSFALPDWSQNAIIPQNGRNNPYLLNNSEFNKTQLNGKFHTQVYPVTVTGVLPPYRPIKYFIENDHHDPLRYILQKLFVSFTSFKDFDTLLDWIGMHPYPKEQEQGIYQIPRSPMTPENRVGFGLIEKNGAQGFSISCAECHSGQLFGKTVLGLTNRFPRANLTFVQIKKVMPFMNGIAFQLFNKATSAETDLMMRTKKNLRHVAVKTPVAFGLDTSLAQVALSLNMRDDDEYATPNSVDSLFPRKDLLDHFVADSKPAVWWNLKYKTRWLSDGSVINGNPIFTNILWNEIGRGTDLRELEVWLKNNDQKIKELTTAVFSTEAPKITDFFSRDKINVSLAQRGEALFNQNCAKCHGHYLKIWPNIETVEVRYPQPTDVKDVGTDSQRYLGMKSLEKLNKLKISKSNNTIIQAQKGYVPPPLVGIWARWPYLHNNSVPSLCALLTPAHKRPVTYYAGEAIDQTRDFDFECNGYPVGQKTPTQWKKRLYLYDTRGKGMSNSGHEKMLLNEDGSEKFSALDKSALIQFLQTL